MKRRLPSFLARARGGGGAAEAEERALEARTPPLLSLPGAVYVVAGEGDAAKAVGMVYDWRKCTP